MNVSDKVLIDKTLAGSHRAFGQLIERYQDFVFSLCLQVLKSREEAEEAAQDAFLKVFSKLSTYKRTARFSTWLYTLVYRTALDYLKKKKHSNYSLEDDKNAIQLAAPRSVEASFSTEQKDLQNVLQNVINQLPTSDATILSLYYLQGQSVKEITEVTGLSKTNVKTKLFRSREKLKSKLEQKYGGEINVLLKI